MAAQGSVPLTRRRRPARSRAGHRAGAPAEAVEVTVARLGARGDGIADTPAGPLYIPLTVPGDRVRVRPGNARGDGRGAEVEDLLAAGPDRGEPPCRHFGDCGGCALQHLRDGAYATWKHERLTAALARAGMADVAVAPMARTPPAGRRRAAFAAWRPGGGGAVMGFRRRRGHAVVDLAECPVLEPALVALLPALRRLLAELLPGGASAEVAVTLLDTGADVVLAGIPTPDLAARERLAAFADAADLVRLSWRPAAHGPPEPVVERRPATVTFGGIVTPVPPDAFLQASRAGEGALMAAVGAAVGGARRVADLFAGVGTLSLPLARGGAAVHAVDADPALLRSLAAGARGLPAVTTETRDLFARPLLAAEVRRFDALVFDPPRAGARAQAEQIAASDVPAVVAVSCNPDTFARDARILIQGGYAPLQVTPVDQFLWSPHLELAAVFRR